MRIESLQQTQTPDRLTFRKQAAPSTGVTLLFTLLFLLGGGVILATGLNLLNEFENSMVRMGGSTLAALGVLSLPLILWNLLLPLLTAETCVFDKQRGMLTLHQRQQGLGRYTTCYPLNQIVDIWIEPIPLPYESEELVYQVAVELTSGQELPLPVLSSDYPEVLREVVDQIRKFLSLRRLEASHCR